jgi:hypothetical protein
MAAMSTYLENKLIDFIFRGQTYTAPANTYIGLFSVMPSDITPGTEISGDNYSRVEINSNLQNWCGTQSPGCTVQSTGTGGMTSNNNQLMFPEPLSDWGLVVGFGMFDQPLDGNLLFYGELTKTKSVFDGDGAPIFPTAALKIQFDH